MKNVWKTLDVEQHSLREIFIALIADDLHAPHFARHIHNPHGTYVELGLLPRVPTPEVFARFIAPPPTLHPTRYVGFTLFGGVVTTEKTIWGQWSFLDTRNKWGARTEYVNGGLQAAEATRAACKATEENSAPHREGVRDDGC